MTSHCLCLREEPIVRCLILRIVNFLSDMKRKWNLDNFNVSSIGYIGLIVTQVTAITARVYISILVLLQNYLLMVLFLRQHNMVAHLFYLRTLIIFILHST